MSIEQNFKDYIDLLENTPRDRELLDFISWDNQMVALAVDYTDNFRIEIHVDPTKKNHFYEATLTVEIEDDEAKRLVATGKGSSMEIAMASATAQLKAMEDPDFVAQLLTTYYLLKAADYIKSWRNQTLLTPDGYKSPSGTPSLQSV